MVLSTTLSTALVLLPCMPSTRSYMPRPLVEHEVRGHERKSSRRLAHTRSGAAAACAALESLTRRRGVHSPIWQVETHALALLAASLVAKYLSFALGAFPAMADETYGVVGVSAATKEAGREATLRQAGQSAASLPAPVDLPENACFSPSPSGGLGHLCASFGALLHCLTVVLSLGLLGRHSDGTYFRQRASAYYEPLDA